MDADSQVEDLQTGLAAPAETEPAQPGAGSQAALPLFPFDETLLDAFLEVGGYRPSDLASQQARAAMQCYACCQHTQECCSYCLLPVCPEHGKQVQPWFTRRDVMVCTPCQAKLEDIAQQEQSPQWAASAQPHAAVLHVLTSERL